ncbi:hypothetical protein KKG41_06480, partial [Patescibacteria group bacterium]|nr:hypothetical protein [Patescibacteria group bacterium]
CLRHNRLQLGYLSAAHAGTENLDWLANGSAAFAKRARIGTLDDLIRQLKGLCGTSVNLNVADRIHANSDFIHRTPDKRLESVHLITSLL